MNRIVVAQELVKIAKGLMAMEFDTEEEMKKYKQEHEVRPGTKLTVKESTTPSKLSDGDSSKWQFGNTVGMGLRAMPALKADNIKASVDSVLKTLGKTKGVVSYLRERASEGEKVDKAFVDKHLRLEVENMQKNRTGAPIEGWWIWEHPDFVAGIRNMIS